MLTFLMFSLGLVLTVKGADWFTDAAVWVARVTRIPNVIIGATLVSAATTLPEFSVSAYAAYAGHAGLSLGNAIGSNIANVGLILGASVLARSIVLEALLFRSKALLMLLAGSVMMFLVRDGMLSRLDGWVLIVLLAAYVYRTVRIAEKARNRSRAVSARQESVSQTTFWYNAGRFALGIGLIIAGSRLMVVHGAQMARMLGVPEMVIGLTLVAVGTSIPELITAITSVVKGHHELSIGNVMGANFLNMTWVLGMSSIIRPLPVAASIIRIDLPVMLLFMLGLMLSGGSHGRLERWKGALLLLAYVAYVSVTAFSPKI